LAGRGAAAVAVTAPGMLATGGAGTAFTIVTGVSVGGSAVGVQRRPVDHQIIRSHPFNP
jgi:hypothetical protein